MGWRSSFERISHLMCELCLRASEIGLADGKRLTKPLTQLMLADARGMTQVHIARVLKELRQLGAINLQHGLLALNDPGMLVRISGFRRGVPPSPSRVGAPGVRASN
ncbi:MAG: helix-turn-helix domain-containing protein [Sphingomonas sp.]|nr:MAG: helix-turn-helix domain-containing protein [Sphingomonas sp.]